MATKQLSAQLSSRDIWYAASELGMRDATKAEVAKVCFLINACGWTVEEAKAEVGGLRKRPDISKESVIFGVKLPDEWFSSVREDLSNLSNSELLRFTIARVVDDSDEIALENAKRAHGGGWIKGKPRK
jgi:hypothetical protein